MSSFYQPESQPPPGQGYYSAQPNPRRKPRRKQRHSVDRAVSPGGTEYPPWTNAQPPNFNDGAGVPNDTTGSRKGSEVPPIDLEAQNQLAPYDEEKAFAEWNRAYNPQPEYVPVPAPVPQHDRRNEARRARRERPRRHERRKDSYDDVREDRYALDRCPERRDSLQSLPEEKPEREVKDLAPTLIGTAAGAFLGRKIVGKGALGTVGGAVAGAVGANAGEHLDERQRRTKQKRTGRREDDIYNHDSRRGGDRYETRRRRRDRSPISEVWRVSERPPPSRKHVERSRTERPRRYVDSSSESYRSD